MKSYIKYSFIILLFFFEKVLAQSWSPVGLGTNGPVFAFSVYNNELYVGGAFSMAGGIPANRIAKWDGSTWSSLGAGLDGNVFSLSVYNGELYAGGVFTTAGGNSAISVAKWNGSIWSAVGANSMNAPVYALIVYNGELYVGGQFYSGGSIYGGCLAKWDGSTWSNISTGMSGIGPGPDVAVHSLAVYNSELYASGSFTLTSGGPANYIAKWNGVSWSALGNNGLNAPAAALNVYNSELYAGGSFSNAGGSPASNIAKWDGANWSTVGLGTDKGIGSLSVYNGELYVGGSFNNAGGLSANRIAKWDGTNWSVVGSGADSIVKCLVVYNSELYAGGYFNQMDGNPSNKIAKWNNNVGVSEIENKNLMFLYPNPTNNSLNIILQDSNINISEINIIDCLGNTVVYSTYFNQIDVSMLPSGVYLVRLKDKNKSIYHSRFIKE